MAGIGPQVGGRAASTLLEKNRSGTLTESEQVETAAFRQIDHLLTLTKAKVRLRLKERT